MKVLVTGGTGFIGSHAVEALRAGGHQVRLLARDPQKVQQVLEPRGIEVDEVVVGDMVDPTVVRGALAGCDAVLHAAAAVELNGSQEVLHTNMAGCRNVLGGAVELGLDPVIYTSSVGAMFPPRGPMLTVDDPVTSLKTAYGRSKADGERYARELQAEGAPVVSVYPAGVYGPHDPVPGNGTKGLRDRLRYGWFMTTGGSVCVDVRDLATLFAKALAAGRGPRRYMAGGHFLTWAEEADLCQELTGRPVRRIPAPARLVRGIGHGVDLLKWLIPGFDYPLTHEAALFVTQVVPCDSRRTIEELGVRFRPTAETLRDAIRWMLEAGHLEPRYAPRLTGVL